ncbi:hypothetical protein GCM10009828_059150 [Actinoplanes couchii]|uniref:Uncharacterized protein n=1 Tax=Actinoplanes couchii TaxID=403638 RepID=A0ABQ3XMP6_9ACTN|nr:hypothetical protein Aco03nite_080960 [Actinoplanes couchii]
MATAGKPAASSIRAEPTSQALGMRKIPAECKSRKPMTPPSHTRRRRGLGHNERMDERKITRRRGGTDGIPGGRGE